MFFEIVQFFIQNHKCIIIGKRKKKNQTSKFYELWLKEIIILIYIHENVFAFLYCHTLIFFQEIISPNCIRCNTLATNKWLTFLEKYIFSSGQWTPNDE